ncbi:serine hydrolase domain-containing protein [Cryobacterium glucosi]|uniref:Class A beta-lactamase-related serine hydrolase n=1 Tax=Cryobacterium glucosi TaxID=1259175 RepID=A0ABY2IPX0_9MICO|nr:serine hydrolase domain-containing protein [Cryobacterium glucosi]TFC22376.1 class A beta-lactamase-related serine hydrolase [Cryobacterium glucosi]
MRTIRERRRSVPLWCGLMNAVVLISSLAGGTTVSARATELPSPGWASASEINAFLQKERADLKLSGLAVVVLSEGSVLFEGAFGDATPGGPAVTLNTPFVLGSTSKQLAGLAIQQLIAQGKLSLHDTVGTLLRRLGSESSPFADVTVAELLSHTSGISTAAGTADVFDPTPAFTSLGTETRHLLTTASSSLAGTRFEYSNGNYTLLGSIIEEVTRQTFEAALQSLVARPLGLNTTTSDLTAAQANGLAPGHYTWFGMIDSTTPGPRWPMGAPSAYTSSTAVDLSRLLEAELGRPSGIDSAVFAADHVPLAAVDKYSRYASGWYVRSFWELHDGDENFDDPALPLIYEHDGDTTRETSYLAFSPDLGFGVVVLSNTGLGTDSGRFSEFTYQLLHTIVGTTAAPHVVDPVVAAAPIIMIALPLLQLAALILLTVSFVRRRLGRLARSMLRVIAALVTVVTLFVAFVVVPERTHQSLFNRVWWAGVPDLAVSTASSLLFATATIAVGVVALIHAQHRRRSLSVNDPADNASWKQ